MANINGATSSSLPGRIITQTDNVIVRWDHNKQIWTRGRERDDDVIIVKHIVIIILPTPCITSSSTWRHHARLTPVRVVVAHLGGPSWRGCSNRARALPQSTIRFCGAMCASCSSFSRPGRRRRRRRRRRDTAVPKSARSSPPSFEKHTSSNRHSIYTFIV